MLSTVNTSPTATTDYNIPLAAATTNMSTTKISPEGATESPSPSLQKVNHSSTPEPTTEEEKIGSKIFDIVDKKKQFQLLDKASKMKAMQIKVKKEQYVELVLRTLACTTITKSVDLDCIKTTKDRHTDYMVASAKRK